MTSRFPHWRLSQKHVPFDLRFKTQGVGYHLWKPSEYVDCLMLHKVWWVPADSRQLLTGLPSGGQSTGIGGGVGAGLWGLTKLHLAMVHLPWDGELLCLGSLSNICEPSLDNVLESALCTIGLRVEMHMLSCRMTRLHWLLPLPARRLPLSILKPVPGYDGLLAIS